MNFGEIDSRLQRMIFTFVFFWIVRSHYVGMENSRCICVTVDSLAVFGFALCAFETGRLVRLLCRIRFLKCIEFFEISGSLNLIFVGLICPSKKGQTLVTNVFPSQFFFFLVVSFHFAPFGMCHSCLRCSTLDCSSRHSSIQTTESPLTIVANLIFSSSLLIADQWNRRIVGSGLGVS